MRQNIRCVAVLILLLVPVYHSDGQIADDAYNKKIHDRDSSDFRLKNQLVPIGLISGGLVIEALGCKQEMQEWFPRTNTNVDDYIQYAPIAILYTSDLFGAKHRNNAFNQTKYLIISELATSLITGSLKRLTHSTRPNGNPLAFPSGHTSQAFTGATVLFQETKDYCLPLAYSGYLFSTATGILRVTNNKHWVSDVLVGAGIGMLVTNLVYYFEPLKNWDPFNLNGKASIVPDIDMNSGTYIVSVSILLK
jgi:hypothetical protein